MLGSQFILRLALVCSPPAPRWAHSSPNSKMLHRGPLIPPPGRTVCSSLGPGRVHRSWCGDSGTCREGFWNLGKAGSPGQPGSRPRADSEGEKPADEGHHRPRPPGQGHQESPVGLEGALPERAQRLVPGQQGSAASCQGEAGDRGAGAEQEQPGRWVWSREL